MQSILGSAPWLYPFLLLTHQVSVVASVILFASRSIGVIRARTWPMLRPVRYLSVTIDTVLLLAGVSLWILLRYNPVIHSWLGIKLLLLVLYIALGSLALKRARTRATRLAFFLAAMACVLMMAGIALARHPGGWWILWQ